MPGDLIKLFDTQADWQSGTLENLDATSTPGVIIPTGDYTKTYDSKAEWDQGTRSNVVVDADGTVRLAIRPQNWKSAVLTASSTFDIYSPSRVMDGDVDTEWLSQSLKNEWLQWDYGDEKPEVIKFRIYDSGMTHADPKDFRFEGSDDGSQWTTLISGTTVDNGGWQEWDVPNPRPYRYYRLFCLNIHGGSLRLRVHEVEFVLQTKHYISGTWTSPWLAHGITSPQSGLVSLRADIPAGTSVIPHVRYSSNGGSTYTQWYDLDDRRMTDLQGTHVQLRLTLATDDPRQTPVVDKAILLVGKQHRWTSPVIDLAGVDADAILMLATSQTELDVVQEVREYPNFTFTRNSTAYNPEDGSQVAVNEPRYVAGPFPGSKALYVEEGTENLQPDPDFANGMTGKSSYNWGGSGVVTASDGICTMDNTDSIQNLALIVPQVAITANTGAHTVSIKCRSANGEDAEVQVYMGMGYKSLGTAPASGEWVVLSATYNDGEYTTNPQQHTRIGPGKKIQIDWIQIERKPYATSFHPGTRSPEVTTIPTAGMINSNEGSVEIWRRMDIPGSIAPSGVHRNIFSVNAGVWGIYQRNGITNQISLSVGNDWGTVKSALVNISWDAGDILFIAAKWSLPDIALTVYNLTKGTSGAATNTGASYTANPTLAYLGCADGLAFNGHHNGPIADLRISSKARSDEEILQAYQSGKPLPVDEWTTYKMAGGPWESVGAVFSRPAWQALQARLTLTKTDTAVQSLDSVALWKSVLMWMYDRPNLRVIPPQVTHVTVYVENSEPVVEYTASIAVEESKKIHIRVPVPEGSSLAYCQQVAEKILALKSEERLSITCKIPLLTRMRFGESVAVVMPYAGYTRENPYFGVIQKMTHYPLASPPYTEIQIGEYLPEDIEVLLRLYSSQKGGV